MPLLFEKSYERLQGISMNELVNSTTITRTTPGAKARAILQVVNRELSTAYQEFDINMLRAFLPYAQGRFLDYLGDMLGVPRLGARRAEATSSEKLVKFFVENGTFGSLNNGNDIFVPSGTIISTLPNGEGIVFRTALEVILPANESERFISVQAVRDGEGANLGPGRLRFHKFTGYAAGTGLKVTNVGVIANGANVESDNNYRFRIANQTLASERANETAIRLALISIPGVSDIVMRRYARGIGSFEVIIQTVVPNTPDNIIDACQAAIARVQAQGVFGRAVKPRLTGMTFQVSVTWRQDTTTEDKARITEAIRTAISDYVNNIPIGQEFIYNELIERIMSVSDKILNIGTTRRAIDLIHIYRESKLRDNKLKEELIGDYKTAPDERVIIEPSVDKPIMIVNLN